MFLEPEPEVILERFTKLTSALAMGSPAFVEEDELWNVETRPLRPWINSISASLTSRPRAILIFVMAQSIRHFVQMRSAEKEN